jgi:ribonuclease R
MQYMLNKKGQIFPAYINGMIGDGIFVELENMLEGFVLFSGNKSNYVIDTANYELRTPTKTYKLGQKVSVKILNIDILSDKVDFELVE